MKVKNHRSIRIGAVSAVLAVVLALAGATQMHNTAHADPQSTIEAFVAAINAGDSGPAVANLFAEDGYLFFIGIESHGAIGRAAIAFADIASGNTQVTVASSNVNGTMITGVFEVTDDDTAAAGVTRILQPFTAEVVNDEIVSLVITNDESDPETATYLAFLAAQPRSEVELAPDAQSMPMNGTQPGEAVTGTFDGTLIIFVIVEAGPAGITQPASIREDTCDAPGAVVSTFTPILDGAAVALMSLTLADLDGRVLVVEASAGDPTVVSCGAFADLEAVPLSPPVEALPDTGDGPSTDNGTVIATLLLVLAGGLAVVSVGALGLGIRRA